MKKIWVYLLGILTGIMISFIAAHVFGNLTDGMSFFEETGDIVEFSSVKVFQALEDGKALAKCKGQKEYDWYGDPVVLLYNEEGIPYYDDQIVNASHGKCFKQVGIYRYSTNSGIDKTVPIVMLLDK